VSQANTAAGQLLVDPAVSRAKFERELAEYGKSARERREQGWWILSAEFPNVLVAFAVPHVRPVAVALGALINFDNYDLWAPSVRIVNPFTGIPYKFKETPQEQRMWRRDPASGRPMHQLQAHDPDDVPFFCIQGVREYHEHPAHTGDAWLLHRGTGRGTLYFLLEKLYQYGVQLVRGFQINLTIVGLAIGEIPE